MRLKSDNKACEVPILVSYKRQPPRCGAFCILAAFVRLAVRRNDFADLRLFTGFLYIIFLLLGYLTFTVWCHLAQLHQVM